MLKDEFVVMPNHVHGIIIIHDVGRGESRFAPTRFKSPSRTVGAIVRGFKSAATHQVNQFRDTPGQQLWQRNYYDRIVRNNKEMDRIREYIVNNPVQWYYDAENPENIQNQSSNL